MWCVVDLTATTAERFFRIDRTLEPAHYVSDIASHDLYIVDPDLHVSFLAPTIIYGGGGGGEGDDLLPIACSGSPWLQCGISPSPRLSFSSANNDDIQYRRYFTALVYQGHLTISYSKTFSFCHWGHCLVPSLQTSGLLFLLIDFFLVLLSSLVSALLEVPNVHCSF